MKVSTCLLALSFLAATSSYPDSSSDAKRNQALREIQACLRTNETSSRKCRDINKNLETLVDLYRQGDKSVLPTLLKFTYLTDFYGEALVNDPNGFLAAVAQLPEQEQRDVAAGLAGAVYGLSRPRFEAIRAALSDVPNSSPNHELASKCRQTLEFENAAYLVNYFPPGIFAGPSGPSRVHWFSRELYALQEKPLWPQAPNVSAYRVTVIPAFSPPQSATLTVQPNNEPQIRFREANRARRGLVADVVGTVSAQQLADFSESLNRIQFWQLATESPQPGFDGADWIFEAVQDGRYHVVLRWCPGSTPFGEAALRLFELAGHRLSGC